jgi:hypothetical protein
MRSTKSFATVIAVFLMGSTTVSSFSAVRNPDRQESKACSSVAVRAISLVGFPGAFSIALIPSDGCSR